MYYRTVYQVHVGEELLVYNDEEFIKSISGDTAGLQMDEEREYSCKPCGVVFSQQKYLLGHNRHCRYITNNEKDLKLFKKRSRCNWN